MSLSTKKAFTCLLVALLLGVVGSTLGLNYYAASDKWSFQNNSFLGFYHDVNFTDAPHQGVLNDSSQVGYWSMDEDEGSVIHDSSGNGNNGALQGSPPPIWSTGKYGAALQFDGSQNFVQISDSPNQRGMSALTVALWFNASSWSPTYYGLLSKWTSGTGRYFLLGYPSEQKLNFYISNGITTESLTAPLPTLNKYHLLVATFQGGQSLKIFIDEILATQASTNISSINNASNNVPLFIGKYATYCTSATIDDVRIYDRAVSAGEIASFYAMGPYAQPNPRSFANYYNFTDPVTNNTMLIHVDSPNANSNNAALITCTNIFENNRLTFQSNNSAIVNVWTNLGQPVFTSGVWNSENCTSTLTLDASSTAELQWNSGTPPSASNLSASSITAGKTTVFSALWIDNQSLSGGGYIFSTNNTGQWINASWAPFNSNPCWGNASLTLNSNNGVFVGFREFANNSLNLWGDSGIYAITTTNDTSMATPSPAPSSAPTTSPTPTTSTSTPTSTSAPTANPTITPTLQPEANQFPTQTVAIVATAVAVFVAVFALAFKKGYITIEVVDEENPEGSEDKSEDYTT